MASYRVDFVGPLDKPQLLKDGTVRVPAYIAKSGVQVYQYSDGTVVKEYRPPEEVFAPESLASWPALALTVLHPSEPVSPSNWSALAKGHVADDARKDGQFLAVDVVVKDQATMDAVANGELVELSCGYFCVVDPTPGMTPDGEAYDAIQRSIVGNHVALGPKGWGRAGEDVKVYSGDSADKERSAVHRLGSAYLGGANPNPEAPPVKTDNAASTTTAPAPTVQQAPVISLAEYEKVCAERDSLKAQLGQAATAAAAHDSKLAERVTVRLQAAKLDSKLDVTKGSDRDVMVSAIVSVDAGFKADGRSDEYIRARFDLELERVTAKADTASTTAPTQTAANVASVIGVLGKTDGAEDGNAALTAQQKMREKNANAWKGK